MKRFWTTAEAVDEGRTWTVRLDGKPLRTPAREPLVLPSEVLARAIAEEWNSVEGAVDPRALPLTGLANAAIDRVGPDPSAFAAGLAKYAEADLACYRAEEPPELARLQAEKWDRLLAWGRRRYDVDFSTTCALVHVAQPQATVQRLAHELVVLDPFRLTGLSPLVTIGGSLLAALAVLDRAMPAEEAWEMVTVDDRWQIDRWGADSEAVARLENGRKDFLAAARFLSLLD